MGLGCFWGVQLAFQRIPGVASTMVRLFKIIFGEEVAEFFQDVTNMGSLTLLVCLLSILIPSILVPVIDDVPHLSVLLGSLRHLDCVKLKPLSRRK